MILAPSPVCWRGANLAHVPRAENEAVAYRLDNGLTAGGAYREAEERSQFVGAGAVHCQRADVNTCRPAL